MFRDGKEDLRSGSPVNRDVRIRLSVHHQSRKMTFSVAKQNCNAGDEKIGRLHKLELYPHTNKDHARFAARNYEKGFPIEKNHNGEFEYENNDTAAAANEGNFMI